MFYFDGFPILRIILEVRISIIYICNIRIVDVFVVINDKFVFVNYAIKNFKI